MMGSGAAWGTIAGALDGRVELHALDLPGHGQSGSWSPDKGNFAEVTLAAAQHELEQLAASSADGRVDLIGHSFGAVMSLALAVDQPNLIRSLSLFEPVLFAAVSPDARDPDGLMTALKEAEDHGDRGRSTAAFLDYWDGPDIDALPPTTREQLITQMAAVLDTMPDLYHDRRQILRAGALESLFAPVMLISGVLSPSVIPAIAEALAARIQDVGIATVPNAGHMAPLARPAQVAGLIGVNLDRA